MDPVVAPPTPAPVTTTHLEKKLAQQADRALAEELRTLLKPLKDRFGRSVLVDVSGDGPWCDQAIDGFMWRLHKGLLKRHTEEHITAFVKRVEDLSTQVEELQSTVDGITR